MAEECTTPDLVELVRSAYDASNRRDFDAMPHHAETLQRWRANFEAATARLEDLGCDERFRRLWRMYLAYCEAGFAERRIGVMQMTLAKLGGHQYAAPASAYEASRALAS